MIQLRCASSWRSSAGSKPTTPFLRDEPEPYLAKSESLRRRRRAPARREVSDSSEFEPSADVESILDPWVFLTKLPCREDTADVVPPVALEFCVGVVAPEGYADKPALAGVEGGGRGPVNDSDVAENGRVRSGCCALWLS